MREDRHGTERAVEQSVQDRAMGVVEDCIRVPDPVSKDEGAVSP